MFRETRLAHVLAKSLSEVFQAEMEMSTLETTLLPRTGQPLCRILGWAGRGHHRSQEGVPGRREGRVVPVIKLAKAIADCCITHPSRKISGYHMESLAIEAFKDYQGSLDPKNMLIRLVGHAMDAVKSPIADSTGQSRYVDDILGQTDSGPHKWASTYFGQMRGNVNSCKTRAEFNDLFCIED